MLLLFLNLLIVNLASISSYTFDCLDNCVCETDEQVIDCYNRDTRTALAFPPKPLYGFMSIGIAFNNLTTLPDENELLKAFPNLELIDIERNDYFNCETLSNYTKVKIVSTCGKDHNEINSIERNKSQPEVCMFTCTMKAYYAKAENFAINTWNFVRKQYYDFDPVSLWKSTTNFAKSAILTIASMKEEDESNLFEGHPKDIRELLGDGGANNTNTIMNSNHSNHTIH